MTSEQHEQPERTGKPDEPEQTPGEANEPEQAAKASDVSSDETFQQGMTTTAPMPELVAVESKYKKYRPYVFALGGILLLILAYSIYLQMRIDRLVRQLGRENWEAAHEDLVGLGRRSMPYVARAFSHSEDPVLRRRAGETLLATLRDYQEEAPAPDPEVIEAWEAWVEETGMDVYVLQVQLLRTAADHEDPGVRALAAEVRPWLRWRDRMRILGESDMMSLGLRDEDERCRELAREMVEIVGFHNDIEADRYDRFLEMERLLERLREAPDDEENLQAIIEEWTDPDIVGEFGNPVLLGLIAAGDTVELQKAAARLLREMLATAYRADDREEMVRLLGYRRLRLMLSMLVSPQAEYIDFVELLTFSPNIPEWFVRGIRNRLAEGKEVSEREFGRRLNRWMDVYADIEEGQRARLRSPEVVALREEVEEVQD